MPIGLLLFVTAEAMSPRGWSELWLESGYVLDHPAVGFGGGHTWGNTWARFGASAAVGARVVGMVDDFPTESPFGLGTVWGGVTSAHAGLIGIVDAALLAPEEEDCRTRIGCRHYLWVGTADFGVSMQPAVGLLLQGEGASGGGWSLVLGLQPHDRYDEEIPYCPRVDLVAALSRSTSFHVWAGRYGVAAGVGRRL